MDRPEIPTKEEHAENWKQLSKLHRGNRFRLMFGMPLLPKKPMENPIQPIEGDERSSALKSRMKIVRGDVVMTDSSDLDLYLMNWQESNNIADSTPIRILTDHEYQKLRAAASSGWNRLANDQALTPSANQKGSDKIMNKEEIYHVDHQSLEVEEEVMADESIKITNLRIFDRRDDNRAQLSIGGKPHGAQTKRYKAFLIGCILGSILGSIFMLWFLPQSAQ